MSRPVTDEIRAGRHDIGPEPLLSTLKPRPPSNHAMWHRIRTALLSPQAIVVLALLFLVTDALLSIFSTAS